jgi:cytochrome c peroxidase
MKRIRLIPLSAICAILVTMLFVSPRPISANKPVPTPSPMIYNPYPSGILPADLDSEIARVLREIDVIEGRAIVRWHALPLPTRLPVRPGPNPPILKDTGTESIETLGELMLFDKNMSPFRNQGARLATCHMLAGADRFRQ